MPDPCNCLYFFEVKHCCPPESEKDQGVPDETEFETDLARFKQAAQVSGSANPRSTNHGPNTDANPVQQTPAFSKHVSEHKPNPVQQTLLNSLHRSLLCCSWLRMRHA